MVIVASPNFGLFMTVVINNEQGINFDCIKREQQCSRPKKQYYHFWIFRTDVSFCVTNTSLLPTIELHFSTAELDRIGGDGVFVCLL